MTDGHLAVTAKLPVAELQALVRAEVERALRERHAEPDPWLDTAGAARYYGYDADRLKTGRRRIHDLVEQGRLRHKRDGARLLFRREWLDAALSD